MARHDDERWQWRSVRHSRVTLGPVYDVCRSRAEAVATAALEGAAACVQSRPWGGAWTHDGAATADARAWLGAPSTV